MKTPAAIYVESGKPMVIDDIDLPDPGPTQVLVRQFATGVCHSQLHQIHRAANPAGGRVVTHSGGRAGGPANTTTANWSTASYTSWVVAARRGCCRGTNRGRAC